MHVLDNKVMCDPTSTLRELPCKADCECQVRIINYLQLNNLRLMRFTA